jgi:hypothetical protein
VIKEGLKCDQTWSNRVYIEANGGLNDVRMGVNLVWMRMRSDRIQIRSSG